jgi:hypothetical protein
MLRSEDASLPGECFPQFAGGLHLAELEQVTD